MRVYAVCGVMGNVCKVFDESPERDLISWTTLIQAFLKMGFPKEAVSAFFFFSMCGAGLSPDRMTFVVVLSACRKLGDLSLGREMHSCMDHYGISVDSDVFLGNVLVDMYLKCGQATLACEQ
ncbi:hypothetical protein Tsubulata_025670 [Turnera subulata]|uniref:Pentatricopeptide repeat-containing protein n=1 Tax=Turnera subulata TaxID=218843 RepID=A0A9Q0JGN7_9ROSI|nr:hypothetical protein Tsubulata_025670 [Turnera subulata]